MKPSITALISAAIVTLGAYVIWHTAPTGSVITTDVGMGKTDTHIATPSMGGEHADHMAQGEHDHAAHMANMAATKSPAAEETSGTASIGGAFSLIDTEGNSVTQETLKGTYSLVFFGFTSCPDICPTTLQAITIALDKLGTLGEGVKPVFITVDPERDTPEVMKKYVANFSPRILALTGSKEQTDAAANAYKVYYKAMRQEGDADYDVDHSGFIYLMNPAGEYVTHFSHKDSTESMAVALTKYLRP
jgi:cytochrome oxidase Cu insertion factor (SCO1/SenC/PrrC family)